MKTKMLSLQVPEMVLALLRKDFPSVSQRVEYLPLLLSRPYLQGYISFIAM